MGSGAFSNKAGYTATLVACGWAGAVIELTKAFGQELKTTKKVKIGWMNQPTDRPTDIAGCSRIAHD